MKLYKIRDWDRLFENNRSRELKKVNWVVVPNKHDGETYATLMRHERAAEIFSAWVLLLQIASKCSPRGTLIKGDGTPHTPHSAAVKSQAPAGWFVLALDYLESNTDWLEVEDVMVNPAPDCGNPARRDEEGKGKKGMEGKGKEGNGDDASLLLKSIFDSWNSLKMFPRCLVISDKRRRSLEVRLRDPFFRQNWKAAIERVKHSQFCQGENQRGWRATFDWFIQPDTCLKIMEGKYDTNRTIRKDEEPTL